MNLNHILVFISLQDTIRCLEFLLVQLNIINEINEIDNKKQLVKDMI